MTPTTFYRAGLGLAVFALLAVLWISGAVGIVGAEGDRADLLYVGALGVGVVGAVVARLRASGMVWAMGATAVAMMLAGVVALAAGLVPAYNPAAEILGLSGLFATLFAGSAWLFGRAAAGARG
ncbi:hypothetical protein [Rubrivirga sp. IMCC45206]|uniref:hypothetical protein n=1 Tax=Rubrivirga sp. IMCC45206 TaxID=3391614 RepID=UPI0039901992